MSCPPCPSYLGEEAARCIRHLKGKAAHHLFVNSVLKRETHMSVNHGKRQRGMSRVHRAHCGSRYLQHFESTGSTFPRGQRGVLLQYWRGCRWKRFHQFVFPSLWLLFVVFLPITEQYFSLKSNCLSYLLQTRFLKSSLLLNQFAYQLSWENPKFPQNTAPGVLWFPLHQCLLPGVSSVSSFVIFF